MKKLLLVFSLCAATLVHAATEVAGVKFDNSMKVGSAEPLLNGAGLRSKLFLKIYAVGLYLSERRATAAETLAVKGPKRLQIVTLRDLSAEQFADALVEGVHKNVAAAEAEALKARVEQFRSAILAVKEAPKGSVIQIDWLPESGTRLSIGGQKRGEDIPGEDFYQALLRIWLGDKPAQDDLKDALLGRP